MKTKVLTVAAALLLVAGYAQALMIQGLTLHIDTNANELWFTGSDSVSPLEFAGNGVIWSVSQDFSSSRRLDVSSALTSTGLTGADIVYSPYGPDISVMLSYDSTNTALVNVTDTHVDYSSFYNAQEMADFENIAVNMGSSIPNVFSSANHAIALDVVPEPCTMALLGLGGLFVRRRK